uniref:Uncharacterized protein n=1 Tax=Oryza nivara TaxID=4536 RepID=A0A0E0HP11_ORYNI
MAFVTCEGQIWRWLDPTMARRRGRGRLLYRPDAAAAALVMAGCGRYRGCSDAGNGWCDLDAVVPVTRAPCCTIGSRCTDE